MSCARPSWQFVDDQAIMDGACSRADEERLNTIDAECSAFQQSTPFEARASEPFDSHE